MQIGTYVGYMSLALDDVLATLDQETFCAKGRGTPHMCGWYGAHEAVLSHALRLPKEKQDPVFNVLAKSVVHWARQMPYAIQMEGHPPGEYVRRHAPEFDDGDTHIVRHCSLYGIAKCIAHSRVRHFIGDDLLDTLEGASLYARWLGFPPILPGEEEGPFTRVISGQRDQKTGLYTPGSGWSYALQCRSMIGLYSMTMDPQYLAAAYDHAMFHLADRHLEDGAWGSGRAGKVLGISPNIVKHPVNGTTAAKTQYAWYVGDWLVTLWRLAAEARHAEGNHGLILKPALERIANVALKMSYWLDHRRIQTTHGDLWTVELGPGDSNFFRRMPPGSEGANWTGDRSLFNSLIQGGKIAGSKSRWIEVGKEAEILTPSDWEALGQNDRYQVLTLMNAHEPDGRYWNYYWPDGERRPHHQKIVGGGKWPDGPSSNFLSNDGSRCIDGIGLRGLATGDDDQKKLYRWALHDALGFATFSGGGFVRSKADVYKRPPTLVTRSNMRAQAWLLFTGLCMAEIETGTGLEQFAEALG